MSAVSCLYPVFSQPKVVEKVFTLPIVSDSYSYGVDRVSVLTSSLQPHLSSIQPNLSSSLASLSIQLSSLQSLGEERLPELVTSRLHTARDKVTGGVHYLDSTLCHGLDQLLVKVPSLTSPTPTLYLTTREAAVSQLTLASTYLASFTLAQLALKVSDSGLETADSLLKLAPASYSSRCELIVSGLKTVRSQVDIVRREGARLNGSEKVSRMESSSLLAAVSDVLCDVLGLNYVLNILGLAEVIAKAGETGEVVEEVISEKVEAAVEVVEEVLPKMVGAAVEVVKEVLPEKVGAAVEVVKEYVPAKVEAVVEVIKEDVPVKVEAAVVEVVKEVLPEKVEAAVKVVKEDVPVKAEAAVVKVVKEDVKANSKAVVDVADVEVAEEVADHYVFGAGTVQKESKRGKKSYKN